MEQAHYLTFGPFRLGTTPDRLWRGDYRIALRPRSIAVLRYLVEHPGRLVTKAELRQHVWTETYVTDTVLRVCIREIRAALGDSAATPQYLETVGQQGYRFLVGDSLEVPPPVTAGPVVGRRGDVDALTRWFQRATAGHRQVVFVSGEAGIGKTTVVDHFLAHRVANSTVRIGRGQCVEAYGAGEPYLPLLDALGELARARTGHEILAVLRHHAPMWLVQLPGLVSETELERVQRQVAGAIPARMLRELAQVLDVLTVDMPLVVVLEDLHWSDLSTVECLAAIAQRQEPSRLLVLGTYRPVETVLQGHPLRGLVQELVGRGQAVDLRLEFLPAEDVTAYITGRLGGSVAAPLAAFVSERTDGNALFMVNLVEHLVQQGLVERQAGQWTLREDPAVHGLPTGLRQVLLRRIEALAPAVRRVLETASVVGNAFAVPAVAAGLEEAVAAVETVCDGLAAQEHLIADTGLSVWPDGTQGGSYQFRHALYQQVLYEQVGTTRRMQLHGRIEARLAAGYGAQAGDIAAMLALHAERGGATQQAVHYLQQAGEQAARRNAYHEGVAYLRKGLTLLAALPDSPERTRYELTLLLTQGALLLAARGTAAPEVGHIYTQAHTLCQQIEAPLQRCQALWGLIQFYIAHAQFRVAGEMGQQLLHLGQAQGDPSLVLEAYIALEVVAFHCGDLVTTRAHLEHSLPLCHTGPAPTRALYSGHEPSIYHAIWFMWVLWAMGYADQSQQRCQEMLALVHQVGQTSSLVLAQTAATLLTQYRRDAAATYTSADALMAFAAVQGITLRVEQGRILRGWALAMQGDAAAGVAQIHRGLTATYAIGFKLLRPYFLTLLAEAYGQAGQPEAGLTVVDEAVTLIATAEERWWEPEVYRLQGELLLQLPHPDMPQVVACFHQALTVARAQQARALELRAAMSLSRLWQQQGQHDAARQLLAPIYTWFTEGFTTPDLHEARVLLEALPKG